MLAGKEPSDHCGICNDRISEEHKVILRKTNLAQTWCLTCYTKWVNELPVTRAKRDVANEFRQLHIELKK